MSLHIWPKPHDQTELALIDAFLDSSICLLARPYWWILESFAFFDFQTQITSYLLSFQEGTTANSFPARDSAHNRPSRNKTDCQKPNVSHLTEVRVFFFGFEHDIWWSKDIGKDKEFLQDN